MNIKDKKAVEYSELFDNKKEPKEDFLNGWNACEKHYGINPEKVPEMVKMLEGLSNEAKLYEHERYAIQQFLKSITL